VIGQNLVNITTCCLLVIAISRLMTWSVSSSHLARMSNDLNQDTKSAAIGNDRVTKQTKLFNAYGAERRKCPLHTRLHQVRKETCKSNYKHVVLASGILHWSRIDLQVFAIVLWQNRYNVKNIQFSCPIYSPSLFTLNHEAATPVCDSVTFCDLLRCEKAHFATRRTINVILACLNKIGSIYPTNWILIFKNNSLFENLSR